MNFRNKRNIKIILADRNEASRYLLRSAFPSSSFIISEAKDQNAILDQVKRDQVDIVCLDIGFDPHLELLRTIKLLSSSIGVILISAEVSRRAVLRQYFKMNYGRAKRFQQIRLQAMERNAS